MNNGLDQSLTFYVDFLSPFSYLANHRLQAFAAKYSISIAFKAIDLAAAKVAIGNIGPANRDMPTKLSHLLVDIERWAHIYGLPVAKPPNFNSALLNRGLYFTEDLQQRARYVTVAFDLVWGQGRAPDAEETLTMLVDELRWSRAQFERYTQSPESAAAFQVATDDAIEKGVFGVPTMVLGQEMWWGNDRLFMLETRLKEMLELAER